MNRKANSMSKGFGKSSKFYVVLRSDTEEFLVKQQETVLGFGLTWCKQPGGALQYKTLQQARETAIALSIRKELEIQVCSVTDTGKQYKIETESTFFPTYSE